MTYFADVNPAMFASVAVPLFIFGLCALAEAIDVLARWGRDPLDEPLSPEWTPPKWPERPRRERMRDGWGRR